MSDPQQMSPSGRLAVQSSGVNDHRTRTSVQKRGKMLEKRNSAFQRHSEKIRIAISPGCFIREMSRAAQANHCKAFFLKHCKNLSVQ